MTGRIGALASKRKPVVAVKTATKEPMLNVSEIREMQEKSTLHGLCDDVVTPQRKGQRCERGNQKGVDRDGNSAACCINNVRGGSRRTQ